jgi:hypothetical protein
MRLGGEIDDCVSTVIERCGYGVAIADVALHEMMSRLIETFQVLEIACIRECIKIDDLTMRELGQCQPDESRSDEPGATSHKQLPELVGFDDCRFPLRNAIRGRYYHDLCWFVGRRVVGDATIFT